MNQWSFCQFLECQAPPHKRKAPPHKRKAPPQKRKAPLLRTSAETQSPPFENFLATVLVSVVQWCKQWAC